jgi:hypothetical protein
MMGGGAFILLKAGRPGPESAKQAENRLAGLLKVLHIACPSDGKSARGLCGRQFPQDMANWPQIARSVI